MTDDAGQVTTATPFSTAVPHANEVDNTDGRNVVGRIDGLSEGLRLDGFIEDR